MKTEKILLAVTIAAAVDLSRFRFADYSGNVASAGERVLVVSAALRHIAARITGINETRTATRSAPPTSPGAG